MNLNKNKWVFVYEGRNFDLATYMFETFQFACEKLGIVVQEPVWYEVKSLAKPAEFIGLIDADIKAKKFPDIVLFLLPYDNYYSALKNACY